MNQREKILAAAVAGLLGLVVLTFVVSRVVSSFSTRNSRIAALEDEVHRKQRQASRGLSATKRMKELQKRSLPGESGRARSKYGKWLLDLAGQLGLEGVDLKIIPVRSRSKLYQMFQFTLTARGNLEQTTRLLYQFYAVDTLHRIRSLRLRPIANSRQLDMSLTIEALSLLDAPADNPLSDQPGERLAHQDLDYYTESILGRNLFGPPNKPPRLEAPLTQRTSKNRPVFFSLRASDEDQFDSLTYSLTDDKLPGASIDPTSGSVRWTPTENGTYQLAVRVADDGYPSKSDTKTVTIVVSDPPPPPPPSTPVVPRNVPKPPVFDIAKHTVLTTIFEVNGKKRIDLLQRTTGKEVSLREGDTFEIGSILGVIRRIGEKEVEFEVDGRRRWLEMGQALTEARSESDSRTIPGVSKSAP